jgi:hypothetical protein
MSSSSIYELLVILPIFVFSYECGFYELFFKAVSRTMRLFKLTVFMNGTETSVSEEMKRIGLEMVLIIIITAVLYQVIENENADTENMLNIVCVTGDKTDCKYTFDVTLYYTFVTVSTVGYGDYFPVTMLGRAFISFVILLVIIYKIPTSIEKIQAISQLSSPYQ